MPVITLALGDDQISDAQKETFIKTVTQSAAEITSIPETSFIVFIDEFSPDNIGVGGMSLTNKRKASAQAT